MGRMLAEPWVLGMIVVAALLLFAAPKLPSMARSLGQSMRILKSEVREMKDEAQTVSSSMIVTPEPDTKTKDLRS